MIDARPEDRAARVIDRVLLCAAMLSLTFDWPRACGAC